MPSAGPPTLRLVRGDARRLDELDPGSVHLVVTSPPYPMIPQWDETFRAQGAHDYPGMHRLLAAAWSECRRVLVPGGILAINIGDALRSDREGFRLWPNHAEVTLAARALGLVPLPYILWKKPFNRPNAFLGSGFVPPNAYVTLDCEFILLFRKGSLRRLPRNDPARAESRFSRAERDRWFSQVWNDVRGARQRSPRGRSGAFPEEIPRRLIRMFSLVGDTVLDPFAGTGTTLWTALALGRNAIGVEWDPATYRELRESATARGLRASTRRSATGRDARAPLRRRAGGSGAPTR